MLTYMGVNPKRKVRQDLKTENIVRKDLNRRRYRNETKGFT